MACFTRCVDKMKFLRRRRGKGTYRWMDGFIDYLFIYDICAGEQNRGGMDGAALLTLIFYRRA